MAEGALPPADILSPNLFELALLTGLKPRGLQAVRDAAATLLARGPKVVLVTSLDAENPNAENPDAEGNQAGEMEMLAVAAEGAWRVASPRLPMAPNGAGDAVAALFLGFYLKTASVPDALARKSVVKGKSVAERVDIGGC